MEEHDKDLDGIFGTLEPIRPVEFDMIEVANVGVAAKA